MMERFVVGRVIFAGDAAHVVSPFGARGGNGAIADVDNLAWKLALVLAGTADRTTGKLFGQTNIIFRLTN